MAVYLSSDGHSLVGPYRTKKKGLLPYIRDVGKQGQKANNSTIKEIMWYTVKKPCFSAKERTKMYVKLSIPERLKDLRV